MAANPKRRWFQFRLRTLLVGVVALAIPCAYVAREYRIVAARRDWVKIQRPSIVLRGETDGSAPDVPYVRRLLGDRALAFVFVKNADEKKAADELFPEAIVYWASGSASHGPELPVDQTRPEKF